jgi:phosphate transport system permease protein
MTERIVREKIIFGLFRLAAFFIAGLLILIVGYIIAKGASVIDWQFLTKAVSQRDITKGGIMPAIVGTLYLGFGVFLVSIPMGVFAAIYLNEYAPDTKISRLIRVAIRNLAGVPSIVYGLFGFAVFVNFLGFNTSLLSAILTLSCMTLPWVITASEESLKAVPFSYREGAYALGATRWQMIKKVVIPQAMPGMITGSILGLSRALGETAPIIIVGATFYMRDLPDSITDKFMALPYHLFILATQHAHPQAREYALGTAATLVGVIFLLSVSAFLIRYYYRSKKYE